MNNKMLICLCLMTLSVKMEAVSTSTRIYNYWRAWVPGRDKRVLEPASHIEMEAETVKGDRARFYVQGDEQGGHWAQDVPKGTLIYAIKPWEYIEINDANIDGKYIVYDTKQKKHICIKHLSDHPYILNPTRWAVGTTLIAGAVVVVFISKS